MTSWFAFLAAEVAETTPAIPQMWETLGQFGLAGLVIAALSWFVLRAWNRETSRGDRLEQENRDLHKEIGTLHLAMQDKVIPALLGSANAITEVTELLRELQRERERDYVTAFRRREGETR